MAMIVEYEQMNGATCLTAMEMELDSQLALHAIVLLFTMIIIIIVLFVICTKGISQIHLFLVLFVSRETNTIRSWVAIKNMHFIHSPKKHELKLNSKPKCL